MTVRPLIEELAGHSEKALHEHRQRHDGLSREMIGEEWLRPVEPFFRDDLPTRVVVENEAAPVVDGPSVVVRREW